MSISFLENLVTLGIITKEQVDVIQQESIKQKKGLIQVLEATNLANSEKILNAKAEFFGIKKIDLSGKSIPMSTLQIVPQDLAENYEVVAFNKDGNILDVALADPGNFKAREAIEFFARDKDLKVKYFTTLYQGLNSVLKQYSNLSSEVKQALTLAETKFNTDAIEAKSRKNAGEFEEVIKSAPVAKMVSVILNHAIDGRASDIHIEPMEEKTRVRYRIDGQLHTSLSLPKYIHAALVSRIKVLAGLKIDETRIPQDGHIRYQIGAAKIDLRVSTIPLAQGEKVVMRILESGDPPTLDSLGFMYHGLETIQANIKKPNGMFLVTGPTGSGKSTTLFSILNILNKEEVNISTLEDPVEYHIEGVNQSQINAEVNFTFASGLRALLRQDPDIIMVGEIRDTETAELAVHAALTGHIVLATLHTNDAFGAIPRLIDMKVEPFLLVSTLNVIIAQRLVRRLCEHCRQETQISDKIVAVVKEEIKEISRPEIFSDIDLENPKFYKSVGCSRCKNVGYQGRVSVSEVLANTPQFKDIVIRGSKYSEVVAEKERQGMLSLRQDGIIKAIKGLVSIEEVISVTSGEK